jgi:hypothetical protein
LRAQRRAAHARVRRRPLRTLRASSPSGWSLNTYSLVRRAPRPPRAYLPALFLPPACVKCCQPVNWVNEYNLFSSYFHFLMEHESWGLDSNSFEYVPCYVSSSIRVVLCTASGAVSHSSSLYFGPFLNRAKAVMRAPNDCSFSLHERWATKPM